MISKTDMSEHTLEPWKVFKSADGTKLLGVGSAETAEGITDYRGGIWASEDEGLSNARRIVACVNACQGIETDVLESRAVEPCDICGAASHNLRANRAEGRADEAEALLNALVVACTTGDKAPNGKHIGVSIPPKYFVEAARAFLEAKP